MSSAPAPLPSTTGASRAALVVDKVVGDVALEGERAFARVRMGVALAVSLLWPPITMWSSDRGALVGVEVVAVVGLIVSVVMWAVVRRQQRTSPLFGPPRCCSTSSSSAASASPSSSRRPPTSSASCM